VENIFELFLFIFLETIDDVSEKLMHVSEKSPSFNEDEFEMSVSVLSHLINPPNAQNTELSLNNIVSTYNYLLDVDFDVMMRSEESSASTTK
jgi:hypothetical protein